MNGVRPIRKFPFSADWRAPPIPRFFSCGDGDVSTAPLLAIALKQGLVVRPLVSQGCRPIGDPSPITKAEENLILEIGNLPAYQALEAAFLSIPADQRVSVRNNLFLGLAISEYIDDFKQGDFLIRNILGADPQIGALAVGAYPKGRSDSAISVARFEIRPGRPRSRLRNTSKRVCRARLASCFSPAPVAVRGFSVPRTTTPKRSPTFWEIFLWPDSSATERSGRWAEKHFSTGTPLRRPCSALRNYLSSQALWTSW